MYTNTIVAISKMSMRAKPILMGFFAAYVVSGLSESVFLVNEPIFYVFVSLQCMLNGGIFETI